MYVCIFRLPHLCAESRQHLREDEEVTLSWSCLTNLPLVQHHCLVDQGPRVRRRRGSGHKYLCIQTGGLCHRCWCALRACRCPAAACPAWLKSSEKTMANRDDASLCGELTQPKDLRMVNMACTRSTGNTEDELPACGVWT